MQTVRPAMLTAGPRRIGYCLLPVLLGTGAALVLLLVAGLPARPAYAATHTFPGCAATFQLCIDNASAGDAILISTGNSSESPSLCTAALGRADFGQIGG
jgi:hypothetical protein